MSNTEDQMDQHLQSAIFGTPVLNPDEQHRNLGTFHERIDLGITFTQALIRDYSTELTSEMQLHSDYQLLLHGLLDEDILNRYIKLANQLNVKFAIRNDLMYQHTPTSLAVALVANQAITPDSIDIDDRFPASPLNTDTDIPKGLLVERIHQHLEHNRQEFRIKHHLTKG